MTKKLKKGSISFSGILQVFMYAIPIIGVMFLAFSGLDGLTRKFVSGSAMIAYSTLDSTCGGGRTHYKCDSDIDNLNIGENEKTILKLRKFDSIVILLPTFLIILFFLRIFMWSNKRNKTGKV